MRDDAVLALAAAIEAGFDNLARAIDRLAENARSDHPLQSCTLDGIERALAEIAAALGKRSV